MRYRTVTSEATEGRRLEESWGSLRWIAGKAVTDTDLTLGRVTIAPGCSNPRHSHPNCCEVLYLLQGVLEHSIGAETVRLEAGDALVVAAGVPHNATNVGDGPADMIVAYDAGERQFRPEA